MEFLNFCKRGGMGGLDKKLQLVIQDMAERHIMAKMQKELVHIFYRSELF